MVLRMYSELIKYDEFLARYNFLKLAGRVGEDTFGHERHLNQSFYRSYEWKQVRSFVIARDQGLDLGVPGYEIWDPPHVHHMNPIAAKDIIEGAEDIVNPEYLITVSQRTHNAIHYGSEELLPLSFTERTPGDHILWGPRKGV